MARIGCEIRTAIFTCGHWTKSWRCSVTVRMLSPRHWPLPSAARPSISPATSATSSPTSAVPIPRPRLRLSPSCAMPDCRCASVPDIDLDFRREIREELIRRVYSRYGAEHVGLVCSFPTYRLRSAVREIGKALDLPLGEIELVAKLADGRADDLPDEMDTLPGLQGRKDAPLWKELCQLGQDIRGLPRHVSQHPGGMIISSRPLIELVPLERAAMQDRIVCQWVKDSFDDARFIKIDFLALGMLSLVEECVELIARRTGTAPDLSRIDFEHAAIYDRICRGDTVGLFQIESRAPIPMIRRTRPRNLEDLAVEVAIVRPGPIVGGAVNPYVRRREEQRRAHAAGRAYEPPVDHPLLRDCLAETLGVILYQDQVLP